MTAGVVPTDVDDAAGWTWPLARTGRFRQSELSWLCDGTAVQLNWLSSMVLIAVGSPWVTDSGSVVVRPARASETLIVSSILQEAAEWLCQRGDPLWSASELAPEAVGGDVDAGFYLLAFADAEAGGTARLTPEDPAFWPDAIPGEAAYIHRLAVRRAYAGGILSRVIVSWACHRAKNLGYAYLRLDCDAGRPRLCKLYDDMGFTFHSRRVVGPYTVARYQKPLATCC
jgi:GNAT superfamily N-acetyltransferase